MRFVSLVNSTIGKARRYVAQAVSVQDSDVQDSTKLAETLRQVMLRLNRLEAAAPPEATEFEVTLGANGTLCELVHKMSGPVRWWVSAWMQLDGQAYPVQGPQLAQDSSSTDDTLFLRSYVPGRAVIRVEPSQSYLDPGVTVACNPLCQQLAAAFTTTLATAVSTNLTLAVNPGEVWDVSYWGYAGCSTATGMKYAIGCPTGSTCDGELISNTSNTLVANWTTQSLAANTLSAATHVGAGAGQRFDIINVRVKVGATAGNISIQAASAAGGDTTTVKAASMARFTRVIEV